MQKSIIAGVIVVIGLGLLMSSFVIVDSGYAGTATTISDTQESNATKRMRMRSATRPIMPNRSSKSSRYWISLSI